jgi:hypothetical protein
MNSETQTLLDYAATLEWQPIETAPEGVYVVVWSDKIDSGVRVLYWCRFEKQFCFDNGMSVILCGNSFTHWMPLPTGNAGAVLRELLCVVSRITQYNDHNHNLSDAMKSCKESLAKAAALAGGGDE